MNRINLCRIANHLWHNVDQENFAMNTFFNKGCGCAIGNSMGIWTKWEDEKWESYSERIYEIDSTSLVWDWIFSSTWAGYDDTPRGAAKRIIYYLLGGNIDSSRAYPGVNFDSTLYEHLSIDDLSIEDSQIDDITTRKALTTTTDIIANISTMAHDEAIDDPLSKDTIAVRKALTITMDIIANMTTTTHDEATLA